MSRTSKMYIIIVILILTVIISTIVLIKTDAINKIRETIFRQDEDELINVEVLSTEKKENSTMCSVKFTINDSEDKIESIEYPTNGDKQPFIVKAEGKNSIGIDYEVENGKELDKFKVFTQSGRIIEKQIGYTITYDYNGGTEGPEAINNILSLDTTITSQSATREGYHFCGWSREKDSIIPDYFEDTKYKYEVGDKDVTLYAVWIKNLENASIINNEGIVGKLSQVTTGGNTTITANNIDYQTDIIYIDKDIVLDGQKVIEGASLDSNVYSFGDVADAGTASTNASKTVVLIVKGNITINYGVTVTSCRNGGYGGPKGMIIYCDGILINNGTITMTQRGGKAVGEDIYLWQNEDETYEYVPATGGTGGTSVFANGATVSGRTGTTGTARRTGGGGSGAAMDYYTGPSGTSGAGGAGTSYSGGTGGGSAQSTAGNSSTAGPGSSSGGAGGVGYVNTRGSTYGTGGTGNPGGNPGGTSGTGGLFVSYSKKIVNLGKIISNGTNGTTRHSTYAGSSGAGSINIFYSEDYINQGSITATGGSAGNGGRGGNGCITSTDISPAIEITDETTNTEDINSIE